MDYRQCEQSLRQHWGDDAASARHEIYFIAQRQRGARQALHAAAGLARDAWVCARLPSRAQALNEITCAVSLPGGNGWGTLSPLLSRLQAKGQAPSTVIHPRLKDQVPGQLPAAPALADWCLALLALFRRENAAVPGVSPWTVRCCLARRRLWRGAWRRTLAGSGEAIRWILLHNDFDMFSACAAEMARELSHVRSICVQHGLPTDEFFPTRADVQLVWGESSRAVFISHGAPPGAIVTGSLCARPRLSTPAPTAPPRRIVLISQTHTPVFGRSLRDDLLQLAQKLDQTIDDEAFHILLHPEETRLGHPYSAAGLLRRCKNAPHEMLRSDAELCREPALVLGFCSTALMEAAQAGHYVLGIDWAAPASRGAQAVGTPPRKARDADEVFSLFAQLRSHASLRASWLQRQAQWIEGTFAPLGAAWPADDPDSESAIHRPGI